MGSSQSRQKSALSSTQKMKVGFSWQTSQRGRLLAPAAASQRLAPAVASCVGAPRPRPGSTLGGRVLAAAEAASWRLNRVPGSARRRPRPGGVGGRDLAQPRPRLGAWRRRPGGGGGGGGGVLAAAEATTWLSRIPARRVEAVSWRRWRQGRRVWQQWRPARLLRPARYRNRGVASRLPRTLSRAEWWALARLSVEGE